MANDDIAHRRAEAAARASACYKRRVLDVGLYQLRLPNALAADIVVEGKRCVDCTDRVG